MLQACGAERDVWADLAKQLDVEDIRAHLKAHPYLELTQDELIAPRRAAAAPYAEQSNPQVGP